MRRLVFRIDQMPAWAFIAVAVLAFAIARAGRLIALLHQNRGGMELGGIVTFACFLALVIFAVRRRQDRAWRSSLQVLGSMVAGNALSLVMIWPFIPDGYDLALTPLLRDTVMAGAWMALLTLPMAIAMLWLSRRYGSHSAVTERRFRELLRRRSPREGDAA